jgi:uncharacterized membrane protein YdjX (TVP38/TMEM64 family)
MQNYLFLVALILVINSLPAFAPPTWAILIFFMINFDLNPVLLVLPGVLSATTGRAFLAWYFRKFAHLVPAKFATNMDYAGRYIEGGNLRKYSVLGLFLISPISSAQLFEAAGLMKSIRLKPLLAAFAVGRTISYSTYLTGANFISESTIGEVIMRELKSPWAIGTQIAMILGLVGLGQINWAKRVQGHAKRYSPK